MRVRTRLDLGAIVCEHRRRAGLTQQQLADAAGVRRRWVVELETHQSNPTFFPLLRVFDALGLTLFLEVGTDVPRPKPPRPDDIDLDEILARHRRPVQ